MGQSRMIGRKSQVAIGAQDESAPQSFDDYDLRLGDVMRGERATLGKSLLDVQRELRIKASYIAAIENCDPSVFDTPGFIAGYVRSYARYLGMDPDEAFSHFCAESGFSVAHGMSQKASTIRKPDESEPLRPRARNPLTEPSLPFAPASDGFFSQIEPRAIGSSLVLIALIAGIGYGGYTVLQEVQRVQLSPVDQTPVVLSEMDPLNRAMSPSATEQAPGADSLAGVFTPPTTEAFDRLYRPQALDVPVLVARDAPISTLDPDSVGVFNRQGRAALPDVQDSRLAAAALAEGLVGDAEAPSMTADATEPGMPTQGVTVVAVRPAWVEVKDEAGKVLYSRVMNAGDTFGVPRDAAAPRIQVGESGAVYFSVNGTTYGPVGRRGAVTSNVSLAAADLTDRFTPATPGADEDLTTVMVELDLARQPVALAASAAQPSLDRPIPSRPTPTARPAGVAPEQPVPDATPAADPSPLTIARDDTPAPPSVTVAEGLTPQPPATPNVPQVLADPAPGITVVATAASWVEVSLPSGKKIFAAEMQPGDTYKVPQTAEAPKIFSGNAGGVYFAMNGQTYGPYGESGQFGRDLRLAATDISQRLQVADLSRNQTLAKVVAQLRVAEPVPGQP